MAQMARCGVDRSPDPADGPARPTHLTNELATLSGRRHVLAVARKHAA